MPRSRMLAFLTEPIMGRRTNLPAITPTAPPDTVASNTYVPLNETTSDVICTLCGRLGHVAIYCCCPEMQEMKRTLKTLLDIYEGTYAYMPEDEIANRILNIFNSYNHLVRTHMIEVYCILVGDIPIVSDENQMKFHFLKRVLEIRREKIRSETVEKKTMRVRELEQYQYRKAMSIIHEQNRKLAYKSIMYLYDQIKIYLTITEQNQMVNTEILFEIENAYKKIHELKIKIKKEIEDYRELYPEPVGYTEEMQNLYTILERLKIGDTHINHMVQIVREGSSSSTSRPIPRESVECPICFNHLEFSETYHTNCSHSFCFVCISTHLKQNTGSKCPCCRTQITTLINYSKK